MQQKFLGEVYDAHSPDEMRTLYDAWSQTYEEEVSANGYVTPQRCAEALAQYIGDKRTPVLDFGCGTGLSGLALAETGFTVIDGVDLSGEMLAEAEVKNVYRDLRQIAPEDPPVEAQDSYSAIAAIGAIGAGAAPAESFDLLMQALDRGGKLVVSFNDHTLAEHEYEARMTKWLDPGAARLLFKQNGPHLTGIDMSSTVYVLEKA